MTTNNKNMQSTKILPLFGTPLNKKLNEHKLKNNLKGLSSNLNLKRFTQAEIISMIIKGLNIYTKNLFVNSSVLNNNLYLSTKGQLNTPLMLTKLLCIIKNRTLPLNSLNKRERSPIKYFTIVAKTHKFWTKIICQRNRMFLSPTFLKQGAQRFKDKNIISFFRSNNKIIEQKQVEKQIISAMPYGQDEIIKSPLILFHTRDTAQTTKSTFNFNLWLQTKKDQLEIEQTFKPLKNNQIKIEQTMKEINFSTQSTNIVSNPQQVIPNFDCNKDTFPVKSLLVQRFWISQTTTLHNLVRTPRINEYIKSISLFNMTHKGVMIVFSKIIGFNLNKSYGETNKFIKNIFNFLASSFFSMTCLISKPVFVITPDKIVIQLFYYFYNKKKFKWNSFGKRMGILYVRRDINNSNEIIWENNVNEEFRTDPQNINRIIWNKEGTKGFLNTLLKRKTLISRKSNSNKFEKMCEILSNFFEKPVELDLIRLHYPYNDSNILVSLLGLMIKRVKVRIFIKKLFRKAVIKNQKKFKFPRKTTKVMIIPAFLSGLKIRIAGRLMTHKVVPRQTVKISRRGVLANSKINYSDVARFTRKNKRGAFSITVSSGQNFK